MSDIGNAIRSTPTCVLFLDTLPTTKESELAERLWQILGINLDPETRISIKPDDHGQMHAMVVIDRACAADFISRLLQERGESIRCKPAMSRTEKVQRKCADQRKKLPLRSALVRKGDDC